MTSVSRAGSTTAKEPDVFGGRQPPYVVEAEQAVLAAMLLDAEAALSGAALLDDSMFYREGHRRLFRAMKAIIERGGVVDPVTLKEEVDRRGEMEAVGGIEYLSYLLDVVPTAANLDYHAKIVRDKAMLRRLIEAATGIVQEAYEGKRLADEVLDSAEQRIFEVSEPSSRAQTGRAQCAAVRCRPRSPPGRLPATRTSVGSSTPGETSR